eukprot:jgi/Ulvmu1/4208/UM019_0187.1
MLIVCASYGTGSCRQLSAVQRPLYASMLSRMSLNLLRNTTFGTVKLCSMSRRAVGNAVPVRSLTDADPTHSSGRMPVDVLLHWQSVTGVDGAALQSPHSIAFNKRLDWQHVLGWPSHRPQPANYDEYMRLKKDHPGKLIGHRTNDSQPYWFIGVDAVILSEVLDSKGESLSLERDDPGQCPRCAILPHHAASDISQVCTMHQLEVLVVDRFALAGQTMLWTQTCTPHQPFLLGSGAAVCSSSIRPPEVVAAGLLWSASGWILHCWNLGRRTKWQHGGLPLEMVTDKLEALNITLPVYLSNTNATHIKMHRQLNSLASALFT